MIAIAPRMHMQNGVSESSSRPIAAGDSTTTLLRICMESTRILAFPHRIHFESGSGMAAL